jgi:hypothetical protein
MVAGGALDSLLYCFPHAFAWGASVDAFYYSAGHATNDWIVKYDSRPADRSRPKRKAQEADQDAFLPLLLVLLCAWYW